MMDKHCFMNAEISQWIGLNCNSDQSFLNPYSSFDHYSHEFESAFDLMDLENSLPLPGDPKQEGSQMENKNLNEMSLVKRANPQIPDGETPWEAMDELNSRKRKALSRGRTKADVSVSVKAVEKPTESDINEKGHSNDDKAAEAPKDYIHVRARRGQATDSHSLAERVRREKISRRMKLLQDLVPGCNKVTGKAVMLDEIINYVESLQRQVEFLAMKLASVYPGPDAAVSSASASASAFNNQSVRKSEVSDEPLRQCSINPLSLDSQFCHKLGVDQLSSSQIIPQLQGFPDEDDLRSIVQMGFGHKPLNFPVQN